MGLLVEKQGASARTTPACLTLSLKPRKQSSLRDSKRAGATKARLRVRHWATGRCWSFSLPTRNSVFGTTWLARGHFLFPMQQGAFSSPFLQQRLFFICFHNKGCFCFLYEEGELRFCSSGRFPLLSLFEPFSFLCTAKGVPCCFYPAGAF